MTNLTQQIQQATALLQASHHTVALTGAGISTPSGIPDFRSPDSGLWDHHNPSEIASIHAFRQRPQAFYDWIKPLLHLILNATPNAAHNALATLEAHGPLRAIITQNIDLLHSKAGSKTVFEVHGHIREATCLRCQNVFNAAIVFDDLMATGLVPTCPACGGLLKPNIILFGELLPIATLTAAQRHARQCDLMLIAGTSLEVAPAGDLPLLALQHDAKIIIINKTATHLDQFADIILRGDVADILPRLAAAFAPA